MSAQLARLAWPMLLARLARRARLPLAVAMLLAAWWLAPWLEASMARHMLVQLPLLVLAGWCASAALPARWTLARVDEHGIAGLSALLFITAYWMVPRALELSLTVPLSEAAKFASLLALGLVLPGSLARCPWIVQLFFLGNFGAMMAIAGIQYQNLPERLCNAYLLDDQNATGVGLVIGTLLLSLAWCARIAPALSATPTNPDRGQPRLTDNAAANVPAPPPTHTRG